MNRTPRFTRFALVALLAAFVAIGGMSFSNASAQDAVDTTAVSYNAGDAVVVFDGPLNLRAEATTTSDSLASLDEGAVLTILAGPEQADEITWYQVETADAETGWVSGEFIEPAVVDSAYVTGDEVVVVDGPINLRAAAGTSTAIVDELEDRSSAIIVSGPTTLDGFNWYEIDVDDGRTGWVAADFLGLASEQPEQPVATGFGIGTIVFVNTDTLNLRADASIDAEIVQTLTEGQYGTVFEGPVSADEIDWYRVSIAGDESVEGWVSGEFLSGGLALNTTAEVADGPLNLRNDTSVDSDVIRQLETGETLTVVSGPVEAKGVAWMEVQVGDENGYVAGQYLGKTPTAQ